MLKSRYWDHLDTWHRLIIDSSKANTVRKLLDTSGICVPVSLSPPETRVSLLQRHNIQLQHRGPHQLLLTVEMRPSQGFMRQVPQALR